ncbi:hypothetical protein AZE42_13920, partial [Rhizopogon vesiculosus]
RSGARKKSPNAAITKKKPEYVEIDSDDARDPSEAEYQSEDSTSSDDGLSMECPDNIPARKRFKFLRKLSKDEKYLDLVHALRDLAAMTEQEQTASKGVDLPHWANWSWGESYLPRDIHSSSLDLQKDLATLQNAVITDAASAMPVILGLGLLFRDIKRVLEYEEDEAGPDTP